MFAYLCKSTVVSEKLFNFIKNTFSVVQPKLLELKDLLNKKTFKLQKCKR